MNKTELIAAIADQTQLSKKDAEAALKAFVDVVSAELKKRRQGGSWWASVPLRCPRERPREGRNPQTGETMEIKASRTPKFKAGKALKDMMN